MSIPERCRLVRMHFGLTRKAMTERLNIANSLWNQYELALREPGCNTLTRLLELGISIDWLLSGRGNMLLEPNEVRSLSHGMEQSVLSDVSHSMHTLMTISHGKRLRIWSRVVERLKPLNATVSMTELLSDFAGEISSTALSHELEVLQRAGIISCVNGICRKVWMSRTESAFEIELKVLLMIQRMMGSFLPMIRRRPADGLLIDGTVRVVRGTGQEKAKELAALIRDWRARVSVKDVQPDQDTIDIYLGILSRRFDDENRD